MPSLNIQLPLIPCTSFEKINLVDKFKFEFERAGGKFFHCNRKNLTEIFESITHTENIHKIFAEKFDVHINEIINSLKIDEIIIQPHSAKNLAEVDASITSCDYLIAETGTILFIHNAQKYKTAFLLPRVHIVLAFKEQIVENFETVFDSLKEFDSIFLVTGPSRTADIEKVIVRGVHGPQEVYLLLLEK